MLVGIEESIIYQTGGIYRQRQNGSGWNMIVRNTRFLIELELAKDTHFRFVGVVSHALTGTCSSLRYLPTTDTDTTDTGTVRHTRTQITLSPLSP